MSADEPKERLATFDEMMTSDPTRHRADLVGFLARASADLVTFELTMSKDLRRFARATRVIEMMADVEKAYATRVSDVVVDGHRPPEPDDPAAMDDLMTAGGVPLIHDVGLAARDRYQEQRPDRLPAARMLPPPRVHARMGAPYGYDEPPGVGQLLAQVQEPRGGVHDLNAALADIGRSTADSVRSTDNLAQRTDHMISAFASAMSTIRGGDDQTVLATRLRELGRARKELEAAGLARDGFSLHDLAAIDREITDTLAELATCRIPEPDETPATATEGAPT